MPTKKPGEPASTTSVIYIGSPRYQLLAQDAREISYLTESNIKTTTFLNYLIDEYREEAKASLLNKANGVPPNTSDE